MKTTERMAIAIINDKEVFKALVGAIGEQILKDRKKAEKELAFALNSHACEGIILRESTRAKNKIEDCDAGLKEWGDVLYATLSRM